MGLNDLHLSLGHRFMFEPLAQGMVDRVAAAARAAGPALRLRRHRAGSTKACCPAATCWPSTCAWARARSSCRAPSIAATTAKPSRPRWRSCAQAERELARRTPRAGRGRPPAHRRRIGRIAAGMAVASHEAGAGRDPVARLALVLLSPLLLAAAAAIALESGRPVLVPPGAARAGRARIRHVQVPQHGQGRRCASARTTPPRAIRASRASARFLRRTSIDELPQLLNVLAGDMSLVGPRPDVPAQRALYSEADWAERCSVRPGITGLAQALLRSEATRGSSGWRWTCAMRASTACWLDLKILALDAWPRCPARGATDVRHLRLLGPQRRALRATTRWRPWRSKLCTAARTTRASGTSRSAAWPSATGGSPSSTSRGGHQPFVSDDGRVAVVQNGEIFNYVELAAELRSQGVALRTASDTEVILRLYEREGIVLPGEAQRHVRHCDRRCARGRACTWCATASASSRCTWPTTARAPCSPPRSRRCCPGPRPARDCDGIDLEAIHHYLSFNYIPAPWTIWQGIRHVMPGTWMKFTRTGVQTQRWWNLAAQQRARLRVRRVGRGVHGHPGRRHPHPPARRRALGRLPFGRRRLQHHRRPDGAARRAAGQDLLHRLCRPALRRVRASRPRRRGASAATTPARSPS